MSKHANHLRACDTLKRLLLGTILLPINVTSIERNVKLKVLDILVIFNLLLGCPWLYEHQAMPSTLHQQLKMLIKEQVVTIEGDNLFCTITNN